MRMLPFSVSRVNRGLFTILALAPALTTQSSDWPRFRGPDRNGISTEPGLRESGKAPLLWETRVGLGYASPVIGGGRVIISGHDGKNRDTLFCLDEESGSERWKFSYDQPLGDLYFDGGTTGTATLDGDRVYHVAREGELFCLDSNNGDVIWQRNLQKDFGYSKPTWGFTGAPLVLEDRLYVTAGEAGIALHKHDGDPIWKSDNEEAGYTTPYPVERSGRQFIIFSNKRFYTCVDAESGEKAWEVKWMTRYGVNAADPVVSGDYIFISSGYGKGAILLKWTGAGEPEKVWQNRDLRTQMNAAIVIDNHIYGIDGNESVDGTGLKCLELLTGATKWLETSVGHGTLTAVQGNLLVLTEQGDLQVAAATPSGYKPTFTQKVLEPRVWTVPVYANGRAYCRNASGSLVAVGMKQ